MLRHTRNTYQHGWIATQPSKNNKELAFVYRWRERRLQGGYIQRSRQIGLVSELKTVAKALRAAERFRFENNAQPRFTFAASVRGVWFSTKRAPTGSSPTLPGTFATTTSSSTCGRRAGRDSSSSRAWPCDTTTAETVVLVYTYIDPM